MKRILHVILSFALVGGLFTASAAPRQANNITDGRGTWTGTVSQKDGVYFLKQEGTDVTVELRGSGLAKHAGHRVQLSWIALPEQTPAPGASRVVKVGRVTVLAAAGAAGAAGAGAAAAAGSATAAGTAAAGAAGAAAAGTAATAVLSTTAVVAVSTGVTAATVGSLYATDVIGGDDQPASRP